MYEYLRFKVRLENYAYANTLRFPLRLSKVKVSKDTIIRRTRTPLAPSVPITFHGAMEVE